MSEQLGVMSRLEANFAQERARRDTWAPDLIDWGHAFEAVNDPTPSDYAEYLTRRTLLLASVVPGLNPQLPTFNYSHDQIQQIRGEGREIAVELPNDFTPEVLRRVYPRLKNHWTLQPGSGLNTGRREGYFTYDAQADAPHLRTNVDNIRRIERETGRTLLHPYEYYSVSYDHKDRTGRYLDERTWIRVLDPREAGAVLDAYFPTYGNPYVGQDWVPDYRDDDIGARFRG